MPSKEALMRRPSRPLLATAAMLAAVTLVLVVGGSPAGACGGLVGQNGTIDLERTSTLAAYHNGVERYLTSFEFTGGGKEIGSIIPLPGIPTKVERGGDWTLQRLEREVAPPQTQPLAFAAGDQASSAKVILETKIDALDITILKGGGDEVGAWASKHGFLLTPDAPEVLDFYSSRSQIFMAARFDATRAAKLGQSAGDGTPIMLTMPLDQPWVPLRILALGRDSHETVEADVFLLTDERPDLLAGGPGLTLERSEAASTSLLTDLRSDKGMGWVPKKMWFSYLAVNADESKLDYDLAISAHKDRLPSLSDVGVTTALEARAVTVPAGPLNRWWPVSLGLVTGIVVLAGLTLARRRRAGHDTPTAAAGATP
jgi:Uncharacterized protein conserved in bacteria (DUF2330)